MDNSVKKSDISKRILETRKQTEELKAQLQNLIDSGINSSLEYNKHVDHSNYDKENIKESQNKVQIIKSYDAKHSQHINKPSSSRVPSITKQKCRTEQDTEKESPKKVRNYNVNEAREYIKKQREKRLEQMKSQNNEKIKAEVQKQRLLELRKKSLELVTRNVQAKRERSKSRERTDFVRLDQNIPVKNKSSSQDQNYLTRCCALSHEERNSKKKLSQSVESKNSKFETEKNLFPLSNNTFRQQQIKSDSNRPEVLTQIVTNEPYNLNRNCMEKKAESDTKTLRSESIDITQKSESKSLRPVNLFNLPHSNSEAVKERTQSTEDKIIKPVNNILDYKNSKSNKNVTLRSSKGINLDPVVIQSNNLVVEQRIDKNKPKSKLSEVGISTDDLEKDSKETQTNAEQKMEFPLWLQEKPVQAYPFNFINTVKRKLQQAVNSPKPLVEVAVQSSLISKLSKPETLQYNQVKNNFIQHNTKSSKDFKESDFNSFISHKCLNLDPKTMDHLELVSKKTNRRSQTITKISDIESESDTSKNIPDISSESGTSLKKNAESVKQNGTSSLDVERISSMKLVHHGNKSATIQSEMNQYSSKVKQTESISKPTKNTKSRIDSRDTINTGRELKKTNSRSILTVDNQYTSDFQSGSNLSRSRESIISYNSPTYDKVFTHTFNRGQIDHKSPSYSDKHSINIPENISSIHSIPESISLRKHDPEKYSKSSSHRKGGIEQTPKDMLENMLKKASEVDTSSSSKDFTNDVDATSNNKEDMSLSCIVTEKESHAIDKNTEGSQIVLSKSSIGSSKRSENHTSLHTELNSSVSNNDRGSSSDSNLQNINTMRGSGNFSESDKLTAVFPLKEPTLSLIVANKETRGKSENRKRNKLTKNISLRPDTNRAPGDSNDTNEIHLKFEAEIHLLNDFNESLRQFSAVEKAFESLKLKNDSDTMVNKVLQNQDTQTSVQTKSPTTTKITESINVADSIKSVSTMNYSRRSIIEDDSSSIDLDNVVSKVEDNNSLISTGLEISNLNKSTLSIVRSNPDLSNFENLQSGNFAGMSLHMFEQLIKDEDVRLENLKTILKIREQALLDRTKGELAWLEIQRKHLRETGQLHEASLIKKKQRGILVNHQKEKHEMQRLKQMQKAASLERKIILKEQRNLIKHQLSTDTMLSKMKVKAPRERRLSGPLKVVQSHSESIRSETSISRRSSSDKDKDVFSITSHTHSVVSKVSEVSGDEVESREADANVLDLASRLTGDASFVPISKLKKSLLMREVALQKRRKAAEGLLQWHKKLLEDEKRITELELAANAIISHIPNNNSTSIDVEDKYKFKGKQLNQLWFNLTGCEVKKFAEDKIYPMSQIALERFCKSARQYSTKTKKLLRKVSDSDINSEYSEPRSEDSASENIPNQKDTLSVSASMNVEQSRKQSSSIHEVVPTRTLNDYTSDFDVESIEEIVKEDVDVVDQSINQLINNFSKIKEDISSLSLKQSQKSNEDLEQDESQKSEKTDSDIEISVIETNKSSREGGEISELEEASPRLVSEDKISTSNKNSFTIEEIKRSTKDSLSKSEEVLLRLSENEKEIKKSSPAEELEVFSEEGTDPSKITEDKISTDVNSHSKLSEIEEKSREENSSSRTKEMLLKLSRTENEIGTDVSFSKKSSVIVDHPVTCEAKNNLNKTEEILERLSQLEDKASTSSKQLSSAEENQEPNDRKDDLTQLEGKTSTNTSGDDLLSSNKSVVTEENDVSVEGKDSSRKTEEILSRLSQLEEKISGHLISDKSSSQKSLEIEGNEVPNESIDNLSKIEEFFSRFSEVEDQSRSTDVSKDAFASKKSWVNDEKQSLIDTMHNLSKSEEILRRLEQDKVEDQLETPSKKSIEEEGKENHDGPVIEENGTEEDLMQLIQEEVISTDVLKKTSAFKKPTVIEEKLSISGKIPLRLEGNDSNGSLETPKKLNDGGTENDDCSSNIKSSILDENEAYSKSSKTEDRNNADVSKDTALPENISASKKTSSLSNKYNHLAEEGSSLEAKNVGTRSAEEESVKETDIDEDLSIDENTRSKNVEISREGIIEIIHGEQTPTEREESREDYVIRDENNELIEKISQELTSTNKDVSGEPVKTNEENLENACKKTDDRISGNVSSEESGSTVSDKEEPHWSYGVLEPQNKENLSQRTTSDIYTEIEETDMSVPEDTTPLSKEDINSYEEKEQDSLSSSATSGSQSNLAIEKEDKLLSDRFEGCISDEKLPPRGGVVDVKKRVSEIMADASQLSRGDKSPRLQDLYTTTYDLISPPNSPELGSPLEENKLVVAKSVFGTEAEELLRKQLAIEQEIKQITEQQQKEQLPYLFVREIPNKPPPPYIPPSSLPPINVITIVPTTDEIEEISKYSAKILYKAYLSNNLDNISISENTLGLISKDITKECYKFVFDLCKEISKEHYKQFEKEKCPSWMQVTKKPQLTVVKPLDVSGLEKHMNKNLKELFGYEKPERRENAIIKWSRKNRDHVDEILVMESQAEEAQWTNYDKDELLVINDATNDIMNMLLKESGQVFSKILSKRTYLY